MTTNQTPRQAFKVQTLNAATGNPGWTLRVMATSLAAARTKFNHENPGVTVHSIAKWTGRENR